VTIPARTRRSPRADIESPERIIPGDNEDVEPYYDYYDSDLQDMKSNSSSGLQTLRSSDFELVVASESNSRQAKWTAMHSQWSMEAKPGEWCRRSRRGTGHIPIRPEGIVIGVDDSVPLGSERFVILWFS